MGQLASPVHTSKTAQKRGFRGHEPQAHVLKLVSQAACRPAVSEHLVLFSDRNALGPAAVPVFVASAAAANCQWVSLLGQLEGDGFYSE
jgi:hypothetical protein